MRKERSGSRKERRWRGTGRREGEETLIRILYYVRRKNLFSIKRGKKNLHRKSIANIFIEGEVYYRYVGAHSQTPGKVQSGHDQTDLGHVRRGGGERRRKKETRCNNQRYKWSD